VMTAAQVRARARAKEAPPRVAVAAVKATRAAKVGVHERLRRIYGKLAVWVTDFFGLYNSVVPLKCFDPLIWCVSVGCARLFVDRDEEVRCILRASYRKNPTIKKETNLSESHAGRQRNDSSIVAPTRTYHIYTHPYSSNTLRLP
jgi:hypothetical protein